MIFIKNLTKQILRKYWDILFTNYINNKENFLWLNNRNCNYSYNLKIFSKLKYILLAKVMDFVCNNNNIKYSVQKCVKSEFQDKYIHKYKFKVSFFYNIFIRWVMRLFIEQFKKHITIFISFIDQLQFILNINNIKMQIRNKFFSIKTEDLLILRSCEKQVKQWCMNAVFSIERYDINIKKTNGIFRCIISLDFPLKNIIQHNQYINQRIIF